MKQITEELRVTVVEVQVNDEYRVEVRQHRRLTDYSIDQAVELADALVQCAQDAQRMLAEHVAEANLRTLRTVSDL